MTHNFFIDHAHPTMVVGHPFKGGMPMSTGQLEHPDMKRFEINDSTAFVPPRPDVANGATFTAAPAPTYFDFFSTYFAGRSLNSSDPKCNTFMMGMKACFENNANSDPVNSCAFYINSVDRLACGKI